MKKSFSLIKKETVFLETTSKFKQMIKYFYILLIVLISPSTLLAQKTDSLTFNDLKKVNCEGVDENSSQKKQLQCMLVDVVEDSINYFPSMTRTNNKPVISPKMAWEALRKLYPQYAQEEFFCWTEYSGYYIFSLDCGGPNKKNKCSFLCMIYIPIGGTEFWYFVPRT